MTTSLFAIWQLAISFTPIPEPLTPNAVAGSSSLLVNDASFGHAPITLRLVSGYVPTSVGETPRFVHSGLSIERVFTDELAVEASILTRVLLEDPTVATRDRINVRARYLPRWLRVSKQFSLGIGGGISYGASLRYSEPQFAAVQGLASLIAGGDLHWVRWALEAGIRSGTRIEPEPSRTHALVGGALTVPLHVLPVNFLLEGVAQSPANQPESWNALALAGVAISVGLNFRMHLAATASRQSSLEQWSFGGLLAFTGEIGRVDSDGDGIPDELDACPGEVGVPDYYGCAFTDRDGDGVWDKFDACIDEPGPPENAGCPPLDSNQDGVPDYDRAPEQEWD